MKGSMVSKVQYTHHTYIVQRWKKRYAMIIDFLIILLPFISDKFVLKMEMF